MSELLQLDEFEAFLCDVAAVRNKDTAVSVQSDGCENVCFRVRGHENTLKDPSQNVDAERISKIFTDEASVTKLES